MNYSRYLLWIGGRFASANPHSRIIACHYKQSEESKKMIEKYE